MSMKSKDLIQQAKTRNAQALAAAMQSGDESQMAAALSVFMADVQEAVLQQAAEEIAQRNGDNAVMSARGAHVLTSAEMHYYTKLAEASAAADPKMALQNFEVAMPQTIVESVISMIRKNHPLLERISFMNTSYLTRVVMNAASSDAFVWGAVTDAVTKELSGKLKELDVTSCKLSAFMLIPKPLIELGPQWIDTYVREFLSEYIACGLECGVVSGTGKDQPIGMIRDVSESASVVGGVYPEQTPVALESLGAKDLGALVAKLTRDPADPTKARAIAPGDLLFIVNPFDYWGKIMPGTCYRRSDGSFAHDVLPIPADIIQSSALAQGKAVLGIPSRYFLGLGIHGNKGVILQDDSVKFFEDQRGYLAKLYGNGRPMDEYAFLLLDITNMTVDEGASVTVKGIVATKEQDT